jgi:hypothetical protein
MNDYDADAKKNGITDGIVLLSNQSHVDITSGRTYLVVASNYIFKRNGEAGQGNQLDVYVCPAKRPSRLANHGMGVGETLGTSRATNFRAEFLRRAAPPRA